MSGTAERIKKIRQDMGKTRKEFADLIGVTVGAVGHWETGIRTPSKTVFILLEELNKEGKDEAKDY